jgi:hypothetical protein
MKTPDQIAEIESRSATRSRDLYDISSLKHDIDNSGEHALPFLDFIPIRLVTIIEHSVRGAIQEAVDQSTIYSDRAIAGIAKFSGKHLAQILKTFSEGRVTIGQIASHAFSAGSTSEIISSLNAIFDKDITKALASTRTKWAEEEKNEDETIIEDINATLSSIEKLLLVRHILVHERPTHAPYLKDDIPIFIYSAHKFVRALEWFVIGELYGTIPYTQSQMNADASAKSRAAQNTLDELRGGTEFAFRQPSTKQEEIEYHWDAFCRLSSQNYAGYLDDGFTGTISPLLYADAFHFMTEWRIQQFKNYGSRWEPSDD